MEIVSLPSAGLSYRSRLRGTQGGRVYTTAQVWAPAGLHGARSGRSKSRELASNHGIAFPLSQSIAGQWKPLQYKKFALLLLLLYHVCITQPLKLTSSLLCDSHGTTAVTHQALRCLGVCACVSCFLSNYLVGNRNAHIITHQVIGCWAGAGRYKPTLPRDFKCNRAGHGTHNSSGTKAVQQHQRFKPWSV